MGLWAELRVDKVPNLSRATVQPSCLVFSVVFDAAGLFDRSLGFLYFLYFFFRCTRYDFVFRIKRKTAGTDAV